MNNVSNYIPLSRRLIYSMATVLMRNPHVRLVDAMGRAISLLVVIQFMLFFLVCVWLDIKSRFPAILHSPLTKGTVLTLLVAYYIVSMFHYTRKRDLLRYYRVWLKLGRERQKNGLWVLGGFLTLALCLLALYLSIGVK